MKIIEQKLESYKPQSRQEEFNAFKEVVQELVLFALSRSDFFKKACFMGGTALRILYGLPRFSEDLDFSLIKADQNFLWRPYLHDIQRELEAYGIQLEVKDRSELPSVVKKAFLKEQSFGQLLSLKYDRKKSDSYVVTIRIEIDSSAPEKARFESKIVDYPIPHSVLVYDRPTLFAGKLNALLTRNFVKGRDWFDFVWYVSQKTSVNFEFLSNALHQFGMRFPLVGKTPEESLRESLILKLRSIDWREARQDVEFLLREKDVQNLDLWGSDFFENYVNRLRFFT